MRTQTGGTRSHVTRAGVSFGMSFAPLFAPRIWRAKALSTACRTKTDGRASVERSRRLHLTSVTGFVHAVVAVYTSAAMSAVQSVIVDNGTISLDKKFFPPTDWEETGESCNPAICDVQRGDFFSPLFLFSIAYLFTMFYNLSIYYVL